MNDLNDSLLQNDRFLGYDSTANVHFNYRTIFSFVAQGARRFSDGQVAHETGFQERCISGLAQGGAKEGHPRAENQAASGAA